MMYSTPNLLLSNDMSGIREYVAKRTSHTMTAVFCEAGSADVEVNHQIIHIGANELYVRLPAFDTEFGGYKASPDFRFIQLTVDQSIFDQVMLDHFHIEPHWWEKQQYLKANPVLHLTEAGIALAHAYFNLLTLQMEAPRTAYRNQIVMSLGRAASLDVLNRLERVVVESSDGSQKSISQGDYLFYEFMRLLQANSEQREVQWFAAQMHITPKYLSEVCKLRSGRSASEWIAYVTIAEIKKQLRNSSLPIHEIAAKLDFPNASFFCQYTKKHTGLTPNQLRKQKDLE